MAVYKIVVIENMFNEGAGWETGIITLKAESASAIPSASFNWIPIELEEKVSQCCYGRTIEF